MLADDNFGGSKETEHRNEGKLDTRNKWHEKDGYDILRLVKPPID